MSLIVELDEQTAAFVQELASNEQRSAVEVIHDALAVYAGVNGGKRPMPTGMGKYRSDYTDTAQNVREILKKAVEDGEWP